MFTTVYNILMKFREFVFRGYLDDGEKIFDIAHKHIITFKVKAAKVTFFGLLLPLALYLLFPSPKIALVSIVWGLVGFGGIIFHFIDWYYDCWLITNVGVIAFHRNGFFDVSTQRVDYHLVDDISYTFKGVLQTVMKYGDITIDKLVTGRGVMLQDAANPKKLERKISQYKERFVNAKAVKDHEQLKGMLADMISHYSQNTSE